MMLRTIKIIALLRQLIRTLSKLLRRWDTFVSGEIEYFTDVSDYGSSKITWAFSELQRLEENLNQLMASCEGVRRDVSCINLF